MLQALRGSVGSIVIKALMGLLILAFATWGINDIFSPTGHGAAMATVGDRDVSRAEFEDAYRRQANFLLQRGLSPEQLIQMGLAEQVINDMVNRALFEAETAELGVGVSDEVAAQEIFNNEAFKNAQGQFDRSRFELAMSELRHTEQSYIRTLRREMGAERMVESLAIGVEANQQLADTLYRWREERRDADFLRIPVDASLDVGTPDDATLDEFYADNREVFRSPELRGLTFILLSPAKLAEEITIDDAELADLYQERLDRFTTVETRHLQQMLLPDQATAEQAAARLGEGADFIAIAKELGGMEESAVDLGTLSKGALPDAGMADAAFAVEEGAVTAPVEGLFGWVIVKAVKVTPSVTLPLADVKDQLAREVAIDQATDETFRLSTQLDDALGGGASLEEAAANLNLDVVKLDGVSRSGTDQDGNTVTSIPADPAFLRIAFDTDEGLDSLVEQMDRNSFFVLRVDKIEETRIRALDEVRARAVALWQDDQRREAAQARADKLAEAVNNGGDIAQIAAEEGLELNMARDLDRQGSSSDSNGFPVTAAADLFTLAPGKAAASYTGNDYALVKLIEVKHATSGSDGAAVDSLRGQIAGEMQNDIVEQFNAALRKRHDVSVNRIQLNEFISYLQQQ